MECVGKQSPLPLLSPSALYQRIVAADATGRIAARVQRERERDTVERDLVAEVERVDAAIRAPLYRDVLVAERLQCLMAVYYSFSTVSNRELHRLHAVPTHDEAPVCRPGPTYDELELGAYLGQHGYLRQDRALPWAVARRLGHNDRPVGVILVIVILGSRARAGHATRRAMAARSDLIASEDIAVVRGYKLACVEDM